MKDYTTRVELMAIPIVAVIFGGGPCILALASAAGMWAWLLVGVRRHRPGRAAHRASTRGAIPIRPPATPAPATPQAGAGGRRRRTACS